MAYIAYIGLYRLYTDLAYVLPSSSHLRGPHALLTNPPAGVCISGCIVLLIIGIALKWNGIVVEMQYCVFIIDCIV